MNLTWPKYTDGETRLLDPDGRELGRAAGDIPASRSMTRET